MLGCKRWAPALRRARHPKGRRSRLTGPFGIGFPEPLFLARTVQIRHVELLGSAKHLRLRLGQGDAYREAVWFNVPPEAMSLQAGQFIDIVFHLSIDEWNSVQRQELLIMA